jgi:hypothetical protein
MKPEIVQFEPEHLLAFDWREFNREECVHWTRELMQRYPSIAYTGVVDGSVLGCAGLILFDKQTAFAWLAASDRLERHKFWFHRTTKRYFGALMRSLALKHVFTWVRDDSSRNRRWIEAMGFQPQAERQTEPDGTVHLKYAIGAM